MHDARTKTDAAPPRERFSPLKMVARALGAWSSEPDAPVAAQTAAAPDLVLPMIHPEPFARVAAPEPSADAFLAIVNAMLTIDGELAPEEAEIDLVALMAEAHDVFSPAARARGTALALAVAPSAQGLWRGDDLRLRQLLLNLVSGALAATADDAVALTAEGAHGRLTLQLDSPEAVVALRRAERSTARRPPPLALARNAALALGGEVLATPGEGVRIDLPLERLVVAPQIATPASAPVSAPEPVAAFEPGLRVLVAEESPAYQQVLRTLFAGLDVEAVVVGDGQDAVAAWRQERWDALLVDLDGEAIGGRTLIRSIRSAEEVLGWPRTPILALAARDLDEQLAGQTDGRLAKPLHASALRQALADALSGEPTEDLAEAAMA